MSRSPLVSVLIAVFNGEESLAKALDSIVAQTMKDYEIIVVDDGSQDKSASIAARYPCRVIRQENLGVGAARERLLEEASGTWCAFLDHDDQWDAQFLERMTAQIGDASYVQIYCECRLVTPDGATIGYEMPAPLGPESLGHIIPQRIWNPCSVFERAPMLEVGGFQSGLRAGEDWLAWFLLASRGRLKHISECLVTVLRRPNSASAPTEAYFRAEQAVIEEVLSRFGELYPELTPERTRFYRRALRQKLGLILSLIATLLDHDGKSREASAMHRRAIGLAPRLKGVWYRGVRSFIGRPAPFPFR